MKKITLLAILLLAGSTLFAQKKWVVDKAHAKVGFTVRHMMLSDVDGVFKKFDATVISSKEDFSDAVFEIIIDAASINTDNDMRDNDLRGENYFNVAKYPQIAFKSTAVDKGDGHDFKVTGNLTMHGVTKPVTLNVTLNGIGKGMNQKPVAGFKVSGTINRTDFGVGNAPSAMVGDKIELRANGEFGQE